MPFVLCVLMLFLSVGVAFADIPSGSLFTPVPAKAEADASAFVGRAETGLFAVMPAPDPAVAKKVPLIMRGTDVQVIRALIQQAESGRAGYDAVHFGARIKPPKRPSQMTLSEVLAWIDATPGQPHAIGRYQFIPKTLRRVIAKTGANKSHRFDHRMQDKLADVLLVEAGLNQFRAGALGRKGFMNNLAKIWAGLPNSTGKSHYDGYAGNKAVVSWAHFDAVMARISPANRQPPNR